MLIRDVRRRTTQHNHLRRMGSVLPSRGSPYHGVQPRIRTCNTTPKYPPRDDFTLKRMQGNIYCVIGDNCSAHSDRRTALRPRWARRPPKSQTFHTQHSALTSATMITPFDLCVAPQSSCPCSAICSNPSPTHFTAPSRRAPNLLSKTAGLINPYFLSL